MFDADERRVMNENTNNLRKKFAMQKSNSVNDRIAADESRKLSIANFYAAILMPSSM